MFLVTVVVPIYNVENYLVQCIQTILDQSYKNLEIILVDDGSPDNSGVICDEFATKDNRIKVIHKKNGGLSDARNVGIDKATGEYITFIDSDDYIMPDMVESLMNTIVKEKVDIAQCAYVRCLGDVTDSIQSGQSSSSEYTVFSDNKMSAYLDDKKIITAAWGKIYKKALFDKIRFPVGRIHEDVFTTYKLIHEAHSVIVLDKVGYVYRFNENSITNSKFTPKKLDIIYGKLEQSKFINENYRDLRKKAYSEIIYACNQCLIQMARCRYRNEQEDLFLQALYRQYGVNYLCNKVSTLGKIVTFLSIINVRFAKSIVQFILSLKRQQE